MKHEKLTKKKFNPKLMTENDIIRCNKTILSYFNNNLTRMEGSAVNDQDSDQLRSNQKQVDFLTKDHMIL